MRPAAVLLVLLAAAVASCAMQPATYSRAGGPESRERAWTVVQSDERPMSSTVVGVRSPLIAQGAQALEAGQVVEGVRLTIEGLKRPSPLRDMAAGHANLCAGYVLLGRYDEALAECNLSIRLDANNWCAYNNRAGVFAAKGWYERAAEDIETGLTIAPNSAVLLKSLAIIHHDEQLLREQQRHFAADA